MAKEYFMKNNEKQLERCLRGVIEAFLCDDRVMVLDHRECLKSRYEKDCNYSYEII